MEIRTWRFIDSGYRDPYMNMAIDEALVQLMGSEDLPILRFFDWSQPSVSIGYSQRMEKEGIPIVRRPTGGGVVFHGSDVTYSVILSKQIGMDLKGVYSLVQSWIKKGLDKLGLKTTQYRGINKGVARYCFKSPGLGDIMIGDTKVGGLAGRRIRQKILCQGYLDLTVQGEALHSVTKEEIRRAIINNWCGKLVRDNLREREEELANNLCENKYSHDEWNFRKNGVNSIFLEK